MSIFGNVSLRTLLLGLVRFGLLLSVFFICFAVGGSFVQPALPTTAAEPGPLPLMVALAVVSASVVVVVALMILSSRWHGLKLMVVMALTYYAVVTVIMQIETWYFLSGLTVGPGLMPLLFLQGLPVALVFVPLAVLILGRARGPATDADWSATAPTTWQAWAWKLPVLAAAYLVLYFGAGYFIAWQNPEVRAFYGQPGQALPFVDHMVRVLAEDPWLIPFQLLRGLIWTACALPILRGTRWPQWATALVVGLMFSVPQNIGHILPNSLLPINSVRLSHLVETASSTFLFGLVVTWLLSAKPAAARQRETQSSRPRAAGVRS
jgi:hypothetical protein